MSPPAPALPAPPPPPAPLDFIAQSLRTEPKERRAFLDDAVQISRGDLVVRGDHAVAEFAQEGPAAKPGKGKKKPRPAPGLLGSEVRRFVVDGNVRVQRGGRTAEAEHGELDNEAQVLVLTGGKNEDPVLRDGPETLTGERIQMRLDSEDVHVVRPRIVLHRSMTESGDEKAPSPTRVEAAKLFLDRSERLAHFTEDVVVRRSDMTVRGPRMDA